jgi:hypothetical protein
MLGPSIAIRIISIIISIVAEAVVLCGDKKIWKRQRWVSVWDLDKRNDDGL